MVQSPEEQFFLHILLAGESQKKRGGKRGRTGGGGNKCTVYGTVLPHIVLNLIVYCISFLLVLLIVLYPNL